MCARSARAQNSSSIAHDNASRVDFLSRWVTRCGWFLRRVAKTDGYSGASSPSARVASAMATSRRTPASRRLSTASTSSTADSAIAAVTAAEPRGHREAVPLLPRADGGRTQAGALGEGADGQSGLVDVGVLRKLRHCVHDVTLLPQQAVEEVAATTTLEEPWQATADDGRHRQPGGRLDRAGRADVELPDRTRGSDPLLVREHERRGPPRHRRPGAAGDVEDRRHPHGDHERARGSPAPTERSGA